MVLRLLVPVAFALAQVSASTPPLPPPGTLVDLGGWRLHLYCTGPTDPVRPTVVLEADAGEFSVDWSLVQPEVARFARVCSYDRAGQGWSEPGPVPRTYRQEVWELRALLERGGVKPPFLLVGNFRTGLNARLFAFTHPDELAGLILVNSSYETDSLAGQNGRLVRVVDMATAAAVPAPRTSGPSRENDLVGEARDRAEDMARRMAPLASAAPYDRLPPDAQRMRAWSFSRPIHWNHPTEFTAEELAASLKSQTERLYPLGKLPLVVISPASSGDKAKNHTALAAMSSAGREVKTAGASREIHLTEPGVIVQAIRDMLQSAPPPPPPR